MLLHLLKIGWTRGATRELRWKNFCVLILPLLSLTVSKTISLFFPPLLLQAPLVVTLMQYLLNCQ